MPTCVTSSPSHTRRTKKWLSLNVWSQEAQATFSLVVISVRNEADTDPQSQSVGKHAP